MLNLTSILRSEISRIARREIKSESDALKKSNSRYRSDIAQLKRQVATLEQQVRKLEKVSTKASLPSPKDSPNSRWARHTLQRIRPEEDARTP